MPVIELVVGKVGVGKTTICANLGVLLTKEFEAGSLLVDLNLRASSLGLWFGLREDLPVTLEDSARGSEARVWGL